MALTTSTWTGSSNANWTTAANWSLSVPSSTNNGEEALFPASAGGTVSVTTNLGTIATAGATASSVGLLLGGSNLILDITATGALAVGNAAGGGVVSISAGELEVDAGGSFASAGTLTVGGSSAELLANGGVVNLPALVETAGLVLVGSGGTVAIAGALKQSGGTIDMSGQGLLSLSDVTNNATVDLDTAGAGNTGARLYWVNTATADLAGLKLQDFDAGQTLDVATSALVTITGTVQTASKLSIQTSGGGVIAVGLGTNPAAQFYATPTTLNGQSIVRVTTALTTSSWTATSGGNWTAAADWDDSVAPGGSAANYVAVLAGTAAYGVTVNSNIGTIATAALSSGTVGLTLNDNVAELTIASGGSLTVGTASGNGGLVKISAGGLQVNTGGVFTTTNTLTNSGIVQIEGGVANLAGLTQTAGGGVVVYSGTLTIAGIYVPGGGVLRFGGSGLLMLQDVSSAATIDLDPSTNGNAGADFEWTNTSAADLSRITLKDFNAGETFDVATANAVTVNSISVGGNQLTLATSGGNLVVGLGSGAATQFYATPTTVGGQNIVRVTSALTTSTWVAGTSGNWTTTADWTDSVAPGASATNYAAVLGGSGSYIVTVNSNIGTIAAVASAAGSIGLNIADTQSGLEIAGAGTIAVGAAGGAGGMVQLMGTLQVDGGGRFTATNTLSVSNSSAELLANGGSTSVGALNVSAGLVVIQNGGTLQVGNALTQTGGTVKFTGAGLITLGDVSGTATIDLNPSQATAENSRVYWTNTATADLAHLTLTDFGSGTTLDVATANPPTIQGTQVAGGMLTIDTLAGNLVVALGPGAATQYLATPVTFGIQNAVEITAAACFLRGTRIATPSGDRPIETLAEGDLVLTTRGPAPVQWIGYRELDCARHPRPQDIHPIRIGAGAFGPGIPSRVLWLSPDHAILSGGVLIPIRYLINGTTIAQEPARRVSYWHVELPRHGVVLAEGLACESYLDTGNRSAFQNAGRTTMLHPDFAANLALDIWEREACAPLIRDGAKLAAARMHLLAQAASHGHSLTTNPALRITAGPQILPTRRAGNTLSCALPGGPIILLSRTHIPAHTRPDSDDHRSLGLAIARIWLDGVELALTDPRLTQGWQSSEPEWRWTNGSATIETGTAQQLDIELGPSGRYWMPTGARRAA